MMLSFQAKIESSHEKRTDLARLTPSSPALDWFQQKVHMLRPDILSLHIHDVELCLLAFLTHGYNFFIL